jgi:voltage-gated potassium channel
MTTWETCKKRTFEIIEIGTSGDTVSRIYDFTGLFAIVINLIVSLLYTFEEIRSVHGELLLRIESATVAFFAVDYILRVWTSHYLRPDQTKPKALWKYVTSFTGLIDVLSFLPYYLPVFFPSGVVAFRMLRVLRIFRLFRINAYYDSLNAITAVISSKRPQLISSVYIIVVLMLSSSLCMYSLEHEAQPDVFTNAFSGVWWSVSTLLTVGYGDIYPITTAGKTVGIILTCLGVGMVAIPTGIISAGFVEQYSRLKRMSEQGNEHDIHFIKIRMLKQDRWVGKTIHEIDPPDGMIVAAIQRGREVIVPRGNVMLMDNDIIVLGAVPSNDNQHIDLKEVALGKHHEWNGQYIRDLDISRQTLIVMIKRDDKMLIPKGDQMLMEGDTLVLYTQKHLPDARTIRI